MKNKPNVIARDVSSKVYPLFYYGETIVGVDPVVWTTAKARDHMWASAVETVRVCRAEDLPRLERMTSQAKHWVHSQDVNDAEMTGYGTLVTAGYWRKRKNFWQFVNDIFTGNLETGLNVGIIKNQVDISPFIISNQRAIATKNLVNQAKELIKSGVSHHVFYKHTYVIGQEHKAELHSPVNVEPESSLGYKSLKNWVRQY